MKKNLLFIFLVVLFVLPTFVLAHEGSKTTTLPNGEVIWDLNGEWDVLDENIGPWAFAGSFPQVWKITQTGSTFVAVRMINDQYNEKGSEHVRGELDKSGIKKVRIFSANAMTGFEGMGQVSDDGNKIIINSERVKLTATRK